MSVADLKAKKGPNNKSNKIHIPNRNITGTHSCGNGHVCMKPQASEEQREEVGRVTPCPAESQAINKQTAGRTKRSCWGFRRERHQFQ